MKYKYELVLQIESDKAIKPIQLELIQDSALHSIVEPKKAKYFPYILIKKIFLNKAF